jgi:hypothetical protein
MSVDEIEQGKQEYPDYVNEVPIQSEILYRLDIAVCIRSLLRSNQQPDKQADADNHMQGMHPGHCEIE